MTSTTVATDVLVVGAGPAGLSAAVAAGERGRRVVVIDQGVRAGGQIWRHRDDASAPTPARQLLDRGRAAGVRFETGAQVVDVLSPDTLLVDISGGVHRCHAPALILATGAVERFLPFPGWTLPGVTGVGGLQALIKMGLELRGARVVIAGTGPLLFPVAALAAAHGARVLWVAEQARFSSVSRFALGLLAKPSAIPQALRYRAAFRSTPYRTSSWVLSAHGDERVRRVVIHHGGRRVELDCDWLASSAGLCPNVSLAALLGCAIDDDAVTVDVTQRTSVPGVWAAGECTGVKGDAAAIIEGEIAGCAAAGDMTAARSASRQRQRRQGRAFARTLARAFAPRAALRERADPDTVVCRCEDVRFRDLDPAWTPRQAKLWTRLGMGECQGAVCGPLCESLFGWQRNVIRPPLGTPSCGDWGTALGHQSDGAITASTDIINR